MLELIVYLIPVIAAGLAGFAIGRPLRAEPVAWAWEHFNTTTGEVVGTGVSASRVEPTMHAYFADEAGTQWIGTRVTPLRP